MIKVVFMHLEKTGGTTLHHLLSQCFAKDKICPARYPTLHVIAAEELAKYELFSGHYPYDSLAHIPGKKVIITLLRKPKDRLLSLYYFHRSHKWEYIKKRGLTTQLGPAKQFELYEYLCKQQNVLNNVVTNWIGGSNGTDNEKLSKAISRLNAMAAIGIQEEMKTSVAHIFNALNLPIPSDIPKLMAFDTLSDGNNNIEKIEKQKITPKIEAKLAELTVLDDQLYDYAVELFKRKIHPQTTTLISHQTTVASMLNVVYEINFKQPVYPSFLAKVSGISKCEAIGRWTDGQIAKFQFKQPLPNNITLDLVANAFGPNIGQPIIVRIGKQENTFTVKKAKFHKLYSLPFNEISGVDTIEIIPPTPTSPKEIGLNNDIRKLGVLFISLKVKTHFKELVEKSIQEQVNEPLPVLIQNKENSVTEPIIEQIQVSIPVSTQIREKLKQQVKESILLPTQIEEEPTEPIKKQVEKAVVDKAVVDKAVVDMAKEQTEFPIIEPVIEQQEIIDTFADKQRTIMSDDDKKI